MANKTAFMRYVVWVAAVAAVVMGCTKPVDKGKTPLLCLVGGTMRPVFEQLAGIYQRESGQSVEISSAGSGELLANIELQAEGDLYVSHDPFLDIIMHRGLAVDGWTIGELRPVIIVQEDNPKHIRGLHDLAREDIQLALTDFKLSTLGRMLPTIWGNAGMDLQALVEKKNVIIHRSGSYVANLVAMRNADAALVWKAVAALRTDKLDAIRITDYLPKPHVDAITSATGKSYALTPVRVSICSLKCTDQPEEAKTFMAFVVSEPAKSILKKYGFFVPESIRRQEYQDGVKL